ncbi:peptidoglycan-binding protein [Terrabacter sp. BE26]|uniref:peptidoglycan-binding domain-containing protein n=1 Tax=Terrabacter sp. BE26 TaxID=2898152 RepID=UPI0035BE36CE
MQGTSGVRAGNRRRRALAPAASALVLAVALGGCSTGSLQATSAAPGSTSQGAQPDVQIPTDTPSESDAAASGPIPTVTADPLTPTTPTAPATSAVLPTQDTPATVTPVTAPGTPAATTAGPDGTGSCARTLAAYPVLAPGARGAAVRTLQCLLDDADFGPVAVDGVYGTDTRAAVKRVEATLDGAAPHPGRVDAGMWVVVISRSLGDVTLELGSTGPDVVTLQRALRAAGATVTVDGRFGSQTKKAVQRLQDANRIGADGVVAGETLFLLKMGATIG